MGDKAPKIRNRICEGLGFLGIEIDQEKNTQSAPVISSDTSRVMVRVIPTFEEFTIASHTRETVYHDSHEGTINN